MIARPKIPANAKFELGHLVITSNAKSTISGTDLWPAIARHVQGEWGDMCMMDKATNDEALENGEGRLFSRHKDSRETVFWIITEPDRSSTCVLLPEDY